MANEKISQMPTASPLTGSELVPLVQEGSNVIATVADVVASPVLFAGAISDPVEFLDFVLPMGYARFRIEWSGVQFSANGENLAAAVSTNGGVTFINDAVNFDTYWQTLTGFNLASGGTGGNISKSLDAGFGDALIDFAPFGNLANGDKLLLANQGSVNETIFLHPGSASLNIGGSSIGWAEGLDTETPTAGYAINQGTTAFTINLHSTVTPAPFARANLIRFQPYGNGDCNPPTSGHTITAGTYKLVGIP